MACEDFPCCGHEPGCCPDFDENGQQLNMVCVCGAKLPVDSRYSICDGCMRDGDDPYSDDERDYYDEDDDFDDDDEPHGSFDMSDDADALASAGHGMDEDYGDWGGGDDY